MSGGLLEITDRRLPPPTSEKKDPVRTSEHGKNICRLFHAQLHLTKRFFERSIHGKAKVKVSLCFKRAPRHKGVWGVDV
jgi:hypothetical protein